MSGRRRLARGAALVTVVAFVASVAVAVTWQTVPGKVRLADAWWNVVLELGLVKPSRYLGPHFWAVAFSPDGERVAVGGMNQAVLLYDTGSGEPLPSPGSHAQWVMETLWSPDGRYFASTSFDGEVVVRRADRDGDGDGDGDGQIIYRSSASEVAYTVAFHPYAPVLVWGAYDGSVRLVDLDAGREVSRWPTNEGGVLYVTWTPDGGQIVSAGEDGVIRFVEPSSGRTVREFRGHESGITAVSFSSDNRWAVSGGDDSTVRLWSLATGEAVRIERPHAGWVNFSTFLPDGRRYLTVGTDNRVFVWTVGDDGPPRTLDAHDDWLMCVRASADGSRFATTGKDGTVRIWDADSLEVERVIDVWADVDPGGFRLPAL